MEEKRNHQRIPIGVHVTCEVEGEPPFGATARDISLGGMFIEADARVDFARKLTITGELAGRGVVLPGVVRWAKPGGFGVQFGLLGAQATHVLTTFIQANR